MGNILEGVGNKIRKTGLITWHTLYNDGMDTNIGKPKRGRGQPPKGDNSRCVGVTVKMSRNELKAWKAEAEARGMSFTSYLLEPRRLESQRQRRKEKT